MAERKEVNSELLQSVGLGRRNRFAEVEKADNVGATLKRLALSLGRDRLLLVLMIAVVALGTILGIWAPSLQSRAIDIIAGTGTGILSRILVLMIVCYVIYGLTQLGQTVISSYLSQRLVRRLRDELFDTIVDLPVSYLDTHPRGDIMSRMTNDMENISNTISQSLASLISGILTLVGTVAVMFAYCWQLALLSCATVILTAVSTKIISKKVRTQSRRRQYLLGKLNTTVEETISGYRTVTAFSHQEPIEKDFVETSDALRHAGIVADSLSNAMGPVMNCISNIGFVIIAAFGGLFAVYGLISVGVISAFIVYAKQFSRPVNEIAQVYGQLQTAVAGAERIYALMDEQRERKDGSEHAPADSRDVAFDDVRFSYIPGTEVLHGIRFTAAPGKKIALAGATGCGKTTIASLLLRFYDPDSGAIRVGGTEIANIPVGELRKKVAMVQQDTVLFTGTVRYNLQYAREDATDDELLEALRNAGCESMLAQLPDGLNTVLTGAGDALSQGQRQLLSIARAFVADPQILILDEATSSVDTRTEKLIQDAMVRVMKNRTSIIIAHRLSTIRDADLIVVMDSGNIVEMGSHAELMEKHGRYASLVETQYRGIAT